MLRAAMAGLLAIAVVIAAVRTARFGPVLAGTAVLAAAVAALDTSGRVRIVESAWTETRAALVSRASRELGQTLDGAVRLARDLAATAASIEPSDREAAFHRLEASIRSDAPEHGVVLFDRNRDPWAWAGRQRMRAVPATGPRFATRITPFYVILEARRQADDGRLAVSQVLLAADSAVPDRGQALAAQFTESVEAGLEFFPVSRTGADVDAFRYCVPQCGPAASPSDTLFRVRTVPPDQGARKLAVLEAGTHWGAILTLSALVLLVVFGGVWGRWGGLAALAGVLLLTPAGSRVGLGRLFSSATYFLDLLGPVTASAGALSVTAGVAVVMLFAVAHRQVPTWRWIRLAGLALALAGPFALIHLARGITQPMTSVSIGLWLSWQLALTAAGVAFGVGAAVLRGGRRPDVAAPAYAWAAGGGAVGLALLGMAAWRPDVAVPGWITALWLPVAVLATLPASRLRLAVTTAVVAGAGAVVLTWSATVEGRMRLAERDLDRLRGGDPVAIGLLDQFGRELQRRPAPRSAAQLYARWRQSPLSQDDYPAVLTTWAPDGSEVATLALADLGVGRAFLSAYVDAARARSAPISLGLDVEPGRHYVIAVPFPDSSVVTVAVAPRSQLIPHVLVARFLRGERRLMAPYQMYLGEVVLRRSADVSPRTEWRRSRGTVRGTRTIDVAGREAARHVHVEVELGEPAQLAVRGALVIVLDVLLAGIFWLLAEAMAVRSRLPNLRAWIEFRSFRARLVVALAAFFVLPTVGFAGWSVTRLKNDAQRTRDLVIQQTLSDAAGSARRFLTAAPADLADQVKELSERLDADLLWYEGGMLAVASTEVLQELGLIGSYLSPAIYRAFTVEDELEVTAHALIGGQRTRVGYRSLGGPPPVTPILATPRLVDVTGLEREEEDLFFGLLLATLLGLGGAVGLAALAARALGRPVQALRAAAEAVGRGQEVPPFGPDVPTEFASVVEAFERMARDVEASQAALEGARRRTATVLANVATGVVALDRSTRVVVANPRAEELFGFLLQPGTDVAAATGATWEPVWSWVRGFMSGTDELDAKEFSIGGRQIRVQVAALHADPRGCVVALDDTTEMTRAVRVLAWGQLARQIAHEIKNPLTPIRLGMQHVQRARRDGSADFDSVLERTSHQILAEIERLDAIARAFARFGAPPAEQAPLVETDLTAIARDVAALYALSGADIVVEHEGSVPGRVRKDEVKEVLINLIENARDAGATLVTIRVDGDPAALAVIEVQDNGAGISRDHLSRVFEPQFSTTTSGTGLGLAICKRLVESWGGTIDVLSEVGVGSTVRIELPDGTREQEGP